VMYAIRDTHMTENCNCEKTERGEKSSPPKRAA